MKTATMPPLRVDPELRQAAVDVLRENESLSAFMETALAEEVSRRKLQNEFNARGVASEAQARRDDEYYSAEDVHAELKRRLAAARKAR